MENRIEVESKKYTPISGGMIGCEGYDCYNVALYTVTFGRVEDCYAGRAVEVCGPSCEEFKRDEYEEELAAFLAGVR